MNQIISNVRHYALIQLTLYWSVILNYLSVVAKLSALSTALTWSKDRLQRIKSWWIAEERVFISSSSSSRWRINYLRNLERNTLFDPRFSLTTPISSKAVNSLRQQSWIDRCPCKKIDSRRRRLATNLTPITKINALICLVVNAAHAIINRSMKYSEAPKWKLSSTNGHLARNQIYSKWRCSNQAPTKAKTYLRWILVDFATDLPQIANLASHLRWMTNNSTQNKALCFRHMWSFFGWSHKRNLYFARAYAHESQAWRRLSMRSFSKVQMAKNSVWNSFSSSVDLKRSWKFESICKRGSAHCRHRVKSYRRSVSLW